MLKIIDLLEKISTAGGILICIFSGLFRLSGTYYLAGIQVMTMFTVGIGMMVMAILIKLHMNELR